MLEQINQYLDNPEVFRKIASMYPQAATGLPQGIERTDLPGAVYSIAKKAYFQKKQAALITAGLQCLEELGDE